MWRDPGLSRNFKVCFIDASGNNELFAIKPNTEDYNGVVVEILARKPELRSRPWKCYYEDPDGDQIVIASPADFTLFLERNTNKIFADVREQAAQSRAASTYASSPLMAEIRKIHHVDVTCDICKKEIFGFRYKCFDCDEFDMCMDCSPNQIHMEHRLLRLANPLEGDTDFYLGVTDPDEYCDEEEEEEEEDD